MPGFKREQANSFVSAMMLQDHASSDYSGRCRQPLHVTFLLFGFEKVQFARYSFNFRRCHLPGFEQCRVRSKCIL